MNGIGAKPPASTPKLTPDQAARVDRARGDLQDSSFEGTVSVAYHLGILEVRLEDMIRLIGELTGDAS